MSDVEVRPLSRLPPARQDAPEAALADALLAHGLRDPLAPVLAWLRHALCAYQVGL